jgi:hypothetical protein
MRRKLTTQVITDTSKERTLHGGTKNDAKNPVQMQIVVLATARDRARMEAQPRVPNIHIMSEVVSAHDGVRGEMMASVLADVCKGNK